ncbi:DNA-binding response regulator [Ruminococcus sp. AF37-6AT]|jgi:DNA-binding response OmpR family regulator|uniref:DNA-binding response regulator n=2 Tax=Blautia TaxID=572511 RepID=A0A412EN62_9FIRM|nr:MULTISPECIES: response regulator transcription factor [Clostridia]RGH51646.1 DNA-binding response regulator [Ruminococcus sp. AM41-10BH]RHL42615.1 DNA-binding response regulator [Ruminococcus sp. AF37-6AT]RHO15107.1 DNA-binding response regulator [Ruminococcus sp. AM18-44]RHO23615.1 DNA-binding response regulator [Ruminococcus sp. AM18-15]RHS63018.1 DNA-binding response regulator [Ruminococcus sp. AM45-9BH]RHS77152.1 DNA-binding response regulator [Ruminococcus sp. AM45-2]RHS80078.1 DNA-b
MLILTFEDSEEEILNHIISCVNTGARAFQVIENAKTNLSYGDIVILLDKRELFRKQEKIDLSFIEFEILHLLMRSPGRVFSKEQIYDIIWNEPYSGDYNVVMRHICNIREKIEDDPGQPMYIQTVRGVGYRFNGNLGSK